VIFLRILVIFEEKPVAAVVHANLNIMPRLHLAVLMTRHET